MSDMVFIPHNCPSLKNSKIATSRGVFASKTVGKYLRKFGIQHYSSSKKIVAGYKTIPMTFPVEELRALFKDAESPVILGMHFVRDSRRSFDFNNANQLIMDLLTAFSIIEDDSMDFVIPQCLWIDNSPYTVDKEHAGVFLEIIKRD